MGFLKRPKIQPAAPLPTQPGDVTTSPTAADEKKSSIETERGMLKRYNSGRASTVLTGSGASNKLG